MKEKNVLISKMKYKLNSFLLNLKSKKRKVGSFIVIEKIFVKKNNGQINLIKTFKNNEQYQKQIDEFLNVNFMIQIDGLSQLSPLFNFKTLSSYFYPKLFKQCYWSCILFL